MRELFSGIPKQRRDRRLLMPMQAFIDDSQSDGEVLVLAGYLARFEQWERFSLDWQELLDMRPRWQQFKMVEVAANPDRLERAGWFYRAIERYAAAFVAVAIELGPLKIAAREMGIPEGRLTNPYLLAHRAIMDATIQYQREMGINEPVEFIFDRLGTDERIIREGWDLFCEFGLRPELRELRNL